MAGELKLIDRLLKVGQIFKSGELADSINNLSNSTHSLNQEIKELNSVMLKQNNQVSESVKHAKESVEELRKGFEELNSEMKKSNVYFEQTGRSSEAMENLTRIIFVFTGLTFAIGLYSVLKDIVDCTNTTCNYLDLVVYSSLITILIMGTSILTMYFLKKKSPSKKC